MLIASDSAAAFDRSSVLQFDNSDIDTALDSPSSIHTSDRDYALRHFCGAAGASSFEAKPTEETFRFDGVFVPIKDVTVAHARFHGQADLRFPAASFVRQVFHYSGSGKTTAAGETLISASAPYALIPSESNYRIQCSLSFSYFLVRFDKAVLARMISALIGHEAKASLRFSAGSVCPSVMARRCGAPAVALMIEQSTNPQYSNIAIAELEQSMMINFIVSHYHQYSDLLHSRAPDVSIAQVLKAEEYIAEHWHEPLSIETIAAISGTSARSLFRYFRSIRGQSPLDFIKTLRLQNAHKMLGDRNIPKSILGVALKCGYQNASHFARDYKRMFGVLPSQTASEIEPVSTVVPFRR